MAWPLRCPLIDGNSLVPQSRLTATQMEAGPDRHVLTAVENNVRVAASFDLRDDLDLALFWSHWDGEGRQGAAWFTMDLEVDGAVGNYTVRLFNPQIARSGTGWRASTTLDVRR